MNSIPEDRVLKFHHDTLEAVRKINNLHRPGEMENAITVLQEWLKKQHHLTKRDFTREYLERSIIIQKGSLERTKSQIEKMCAIRTVMPHFFEKFDAINDFKNLEGICELGLLPTMTEDYERIFMIKFLSNNVTSHSYMDMYRYGVLICEYFKAHDYAQGVIGIFDYRDINIIDYMAAVNFTQLHQMIKLVMEGYGARVKALHALTPSKSIEAFLNLVKKMFGKKVGSRIHVHATTDTLFEHLPKNILPIEVGGYGGKLTDYHEQLKEVLGSEKNVEYFREMSEAKSTDVNRIKDNFQNLDLGLEGSFRSLNVD